MMGTGSATNIQHRRFPIGALPANEVAAILANSLCREPVTLDSLMGEWTQKSKTIQGLPQPNFVATDSDIQPLKVSPKVQKEIDNTISSYRTFLPPHYDLALVPIEKLVTPQKSIIEERAKECFRGATSKLTDDEMAEYCLGSHVKVPDIEAMFLGQGQNPQNPNQTVFVYQFASFDLDVRPLFPSPLHPFQTIDWATPGFGRQLPLKSIPLTVGPGASPVMVRKIPLGQTIVGMPGAMLNLTLPGLQAQNSYRLIIGNGVHRIYRLAELGHTHVAAMVHTMNPNELEPVFVETPREALLGQRPLTIDDLANTQITKSFQWARASRVFKLQVAVTSDGTFV